MTAPRRWAPAEDAIVRAHYPGEGAVATARLLPGRTREAVTRRARRLGVLRDGYNEHERHLWTWREDMVLRDLWPTTTASRIVEMGALPGRTVADMRRRASRLRVRRLTAQEIAEREAARDMEPCAASHLWTAADDRVLRVVMEARPQGICYTEARALGWYFQARQPHVRVTAQDVAGRIRELYARDAAEELQATA
jgi:hypothetical protein